jgi:hypothetical protein
MGDDVMIEELGIEGFRWSVSGANQSAFSLSTYTPKRPEHY